MKRQHDPPRLRNFKCGQVYHIYQRGSYRNKTFLRTADLLLYLDRLDVLARRYKVRIHAFCLMSNHVHFLLEPQRQGAISRLMQHLQSQHSRYMNALAHTQGHLWHHHFRAKPIKNQAQYCETLLYIERNPVAHNLEKQAHLYPYSSAHAHTTNQPLLKVQGRYLHATVKLYLDRWRLAFDFPASGQTLWPDWLRSRRNATHQRDLAQLIGQHIPIPSRLPFASIRFLPDPQIATRAG